METVSNNFEPTGASDGVVPVAKQQAEQRQINFLSYMVLAFIAATVIGMGGLLMSVFSSKIRKRWKVWLTLAFGGYIGFSGFLRFLFNRR